MAGYLGHLVMRTLQSSPGMRPVVAGKFEPRAGEAAMAAEENPPAATPAPSPLGGLGNDDHEAVAPRTPSAEDSTNRIDAVLELRPDDRAGDRACGASEAREESPPAELRDVAAGGTLPRSRERPRRAAEDSRRDSGGAEPEPREPDDSPAEATRASRDTGELPPAREGADPPHTRVRSLSLSRPAIPVPAPRDARRSRVRSESTDDTMRPRADAAAGISAPSMALAPVPRVSLPVSSARAEGAKGMREPDVRITIGSVEIRAQVPAARPRQAPSPRAQRPSMTLNDYLRRREGR